MPIQVFVADEQSDRPVEPGRWAELAERILGDLMSRADDVELNILFVDAVTIESMNVRFLGRPGPTDVLSFPIEDDVLGAAGLGPPGSMAAGGSGPGRWEDEDSVWAAGGSGGSGPGRGDTGAGDGGSGFGPGGGGAADGSGGRGSGAGAGGGGGGGAGGAGAGGGGGGGAGAGGGGARGDVGLPTLLGDVVICPSVAATNAPEHAGSYEEELALLVVHGILHLCGMDHENDHEATEMEALEQVLLDRHFRGVKA